MDLIDLPQEAVAQIHQFVPLVLEEVRHPDLTHPAHSSQALLGPDGC